MDSEDAQGASLSSLHNAHRGLTGTSAPSAPGPPIVRRLPNTRMAPLLSTGPPEGHDLSSPGVKNPWERRPPETFQWSFPWAPQHPAAYDNTLRCATAHRIFGTPGPSAMPDVHWMFVNSLSPYLWDPDNRRLWLYTC